MARISYQLHFVSLNETIEEKEFPFNEEESIEGNGQEGSAEDEDDDRGVFEPRIVVSRPSSTISRSISSKSRSLSLNPSTLSDPPRFESCVSFTNPSPSHTTFSFNINARHLSYTYSNLSRTFLAVLHGPCISNYLLDWMFANMLDDGDTLVCLRIVEGCKVVYDEEKWKLQQENEARTLMRSLRGQVGSVAVSLSLEIWAGRAWDGIIDTIRTYEPAMLAVEVDDSDLDLVGDLSEGSVPKFCLAHSPVPVTIVKSDKRRQVHSMI